MAKLTKQQSKLHDAAMARLNAGHLNDDEREAFYRDFRPDATNDIARGSAFFTPWEVAGELQIETMNWNRTDRPKRVLDLCAGIGVLGLRQWMQFGCFGEEKPAVTCVEINPEYVEIGRRFFPEAEWICADVLDLDEILAGREFDEFLANPPFGSLKQDRHPAGKWEWAIAEIGMRYCECGAMIVQGCGTVTDWAFSGRRGFERISHDRYERWSHRTGLTLAPNCGIDLAICPRFESAPSVIAEIVNVEFREFDDDDDDDRERVAVLAECRQSTLF